MKVSESWQGGPWQSPSPGVGSSPTSVFAGSGHAKIINVPQFAPLGFSYFTHYNYFHNILGLLVEKKITLNLENQKICTPYAARGCICIKITSTFHPVDIKKIFAQKTALLQWRIHHVPQLSIAFRGSVKKRRNSEEFPNCPNHPVPYLSIVLHNVYGGW